MDFDYRVFFALVFAGFIYYEMVTIRAALKKLTSQIGAMDALIWNLQSQIADAAMEAEAAKLASLATLEDSKKHHAAVIAAIGIMEGKQ